MVAQDDVTLGATGNGVATVATQDAVHALVAGDVVSRTVARHDGGDQRDVPGAQDAQRAGRLVNAAMVTKDDVVAAIALD